MKRGRRVPADMLLVHERRRRLRRGSQSSPSVHVDDDEIVSADEDQLVEEPRASKRPALGGGALLLRKPIASLNLSHIGWSGPIDQRMLQEAIACYPVREADGSANTRLFGDQTAPLDGQAALEVTLEPGDLSLLAAASGRANDNALVRAAQLGDRLVEAAVTASEIVSSVLAGYRKAALACAWYEQLGVPVSAQALRERDEAAVMLLSTLRALLGER